MTLSVSSSVGDSCLSGQKDNAVEASLVSRSKRPRESSGEDEGLEGAEPCAKQARQPPEAPLVSPDTFSYLGKRQRGCVGELRSPPEDQCRASEGWVC